MKSKLQRLIDAQPTRCEKCNWGWHPDCETNCGCECWKARGVTRKALLERMQVRAYLSSEEWQRYVKSGTYRTLMKKRGPHPYLRSMDVCWFCSSPTEFFMVNETDKAELPFTVCLLHRAIQQQAGYMVFAPNAKLEWTFEYFRRWNLASKNNPFGYLHGLTTPEQWEFAMRHRVRPKLKGGDCAALIPAGFEKVQWRKSEKVS